MPEVVAPVDTHVSAGPRAGVRIAVLLVAAAVACLSVAGIFLLASPPASAHDQLLSSDPADGDTLDAMPVAITLTFSGEPLETGAEVVLTAQDGTVVSLENITVDGAVLTASVPATLPGGEYDAAWHIVSGDGHQLEGAFSFTVAASGDESSAGAESSDDSALPDVIEDPSGDATGDTAGSAGSEPADPDAAAGDAASDTPAGIPSAAAGLAVIGAVAVVLVMLVAMRRRMKETEDLRSRRPGGGSTGDGSAAGHSGDRDRQSSSESDAGGDSGPGGDSGSGGGSGGDGGSGGCGE